MYLFSFYLLFINWILFDIWSTDPTSFNKHNLLNAPFGSYVIQFFTIFFITVQQISIFLEMLLNLEFFVFMFFLYKMFNFIVNLQNAED